MTTLGGRYILVEVYPYSFKEFLRSRDIPYDEETLMSTTGKSLFLREYAEYLNWGGLPESVHLSVKRSYLSSVYQKIYLGDICTRNKISNPNLLRLMIKKMAESVKQPLSYSRVTKILSSVGGKITIPTTSSYIEYCEDAWLLLRLHNISAALAERETNSKYYFIDNGLLSLLLVDPTTTLLENLVALSLFRKYGNDKDMSEFSSITRTWRLTSTSLTMNLPYRFLTPLRDQTLLRNERSKPCRSCRKPCLASEESSSHTMKKEPLKMNME